MTVYDERPAAALLRRHEQLDYPYVAEFGGARLTIEEGVFCPTLTNTSPLLLAALDVRPGERVLDVFSGSGAFGVVAALRGAQVVTVDISAVAVTCAKANAVANGVEQQVESRVGDVRDADEATGWPRWIHPGEQFDLVVANPPLLPGHAATPLEAAILDPGLEATVAIVRALPALLAPGGRALLLTSDVLDRSGLDLAAIASRAGLLLATHHERDVRYERYRVHRLTRSGETPAERR